MIATFADKDTADLFDGKRVRRFEGFAKAAQVRFDRLSLAASLIDLGVPGNRLESLQGDRDGQYSIRINDQWRMCFRWNAQSLVFEDVEIVDYH